MQKSAITVRQATKMAYVNMDAQFHSIKLCRLVRLITERYHLMDGTIMRRLRELRTQEPENYDYTVIDFIEGIYEKKSRNTHNN
jgi:hypothetical protein